MRSQFVSYPAPLLLSYIDLEYLGKPHFWSSLVENHLYFITVADNFRHFPVVALVAKLLSPILDGIRKKHTGYTRDKVAR